VTRLSATTASFPEELRTSGGALQQLIYQTATITWADAQPIACDVKSSSSSANNIVIEEVRVLWNPR
jgi:hypothetical protein